MPAATTTLFYGDCPFEAIEASDPEDAARYIESGHTVLVASAGIAEATLVLLGLSVDEARAQMVRANPSLNETH